MTKSNVSHLSELYVLQDVPQVDKTFAHQFDFDLHLHFVASYVSSQIFLSKSYDSFTLYTHSLLRLNLCKKISNYMLNFLSHNFHIILKLTLAPIWSTFCLCSEIYPRVLKFIRALIELIPKSFQLLLLNTELLFVDNNSPKYKTNKQKTWAITKTNKIVDIFVHTTKNILKLCSRIEAR